MFWAATTGRRSRHSVKRKLIVRSFAIDAFRDLDKRGLFLLTEPIINKESVAASGAKLRNKESTVGVAAAQIT